MKWPGPQFTILASFLLLVQDPLKVHAQPQSGADQSEKAANQAPKAPESAIEAQDEKEFDQIRNLIKNDLLEEEVKKKQAQIISKKKEIKKLNLEKYNLPHHHDFWTFMSELWLVKSAQKLNWDFEKPDYGIQESVKHLFETLGHYEKRIKILLLKTPLVTHFALPANENELIIVLSLPFLRTMDLTKLEIAILILEDFYRLEMGYFRTYVMEKELEGKLGKNSYGQKLDMNVLKKVLKNYDYLIFTKGFSFQQQYEVTNKMSSVLKSNLKLWSAYNNLLSKIDTLVKSNLLYAEYTKIYPSPELQMKWLNPSANTL